jgi:hypothetical protein
MLGVVQKKMFLMRSFRLMSREAVPSWRASTDLYIYVHTNIKEDNAIKASLED